MLTIAMVDDCSNPWFVDCKLFITIVLFYIDFLLEFISKNRVSTRFLFAWEHKTYYTVYHYGYNGILWLFNDEEKLRKVCT